VTLLKIAQIGNPVLRERARELTREELAMDETQTFIDDLIETMRDANGAGLAAIQVYRPVRICALEVDDNPRYPYKPNVPLTVLVNPVIESIGDESFENYEGCLSVPNMRGLVTRHASIRVRAMKRDGSDFDETISGVTAGTYQHEVDHLDGVIFVDRVENKQSFCTWEEYRRNHEAAFAEKVKELVSRYGS
jgi:peptide deformylase